jgi:hypothetical protein
LGPARPSHLGGLFRRSRNSRRDRPSSRLVGRKQIRKRADIRREHTELVSPLFNEGAQMLPEGDQSWRLSPLFNEDDQDAQTN